MGVEQPPTIPHPTTAPASPEAARLQEELLREQLKAAKRKNKRTSPIVWIAFILLLVLFVPPFLKGFIRGASGGGGGATNVGGGAGVPFIAPKPVIPITVSFRTALLRNSGVAVLKNDAGHLLRDVTIKCANSALNKEKSFRVESWENGAVKEIGWNEGWGFVPGDTVTLSTNGFSDYRVTLTGGEGH